jgi:hypothetical protein
MDGLNTLVALELKSLGDGFIVAQRGPETMAQSKTPKAFSVANQKLILIN